jgi:hypothetical protein
MTILLPPDLQGVHNTSSMIVEAVYRGVKSREDVLSEGLKIIALLPEANEHHVVEYAGALWVNDMIAYNIPLSPVTWQKTDANLTKTEVVIPQNKASVESKAAESPKKITLREKVPWIIPGTQIWNVEGLLANHRETDGPIYRCAISNEELYYIRDDGTMVNLRTHTACCECGKLVGEAYFHNNGAERSRHPVIYVGASYCTKCWPSGKE